MFEDAYQFLRSTVAVDELHSRIDISSLICAGTLPHDGDRFLGIRRIRHTPTVHVSCSQNQSASTVFRTAETTKRHSLNPKKNIVHPQPPHLTRNTLRAYRKCVELDRDVVFAICVKKRKPFPHGSPCLIVRCVFVCLFACLRVVYRMR